MAVATATMIDTIHDDVHNIPVTAPKVAGYSTGTADIRWTAADWDRFPHSGKVRINQDGSTDISEAGVGDVADYEPGAFTEAQVLEWVKLRKHSNLACAVYVATANQATLTRALRAAGHTGVDLWVANWSLSEAEAARPASPAPAMAILAATPPRGRLLMVLLRVLSIWRPPDWCNMIRKPMYVRARAEPVTSDRHGQRPGQPPRSLPLRRRPVPGVQVAAG